MLGALRCALEESGAMVVCDLCGCFAMREDMRDCRSISPDLSKVCGLCRAEMCCDEDDSLGQEHGGACGCGGCQ